VLAFSTFTKIKYKRQNTYLIKGDPFCIASTVRCF